MTDLAKLEALAKAATPGPWFSIGPPWNPDAGYVNAGSADPHGGRLVCDLACQRDAETGDNDDANDWNDADYIAACDPATVLSLIAALRRLKNRRETEAENTEAAAIMHDCGIVDSA